MNEQVKGHCKHGEFDLREGCLDCIQEANEAREAEALGEEVPEPEREPEPIIVRVRYFSETSGQASDREYSYFSVEVLKVGDVVMVPVRDRIQKAVVTVIDVTQSEIESFRDQVKIIPAGSIMPAAQAPTLFDQVPPAEEVTAAKAEVGPTEPGPSGLAAAAQEAGAEVTEAKVEITYVPPALAVIEGQIGRSTTGLFQLYQEAAGLLQVAKKRVIETNEDLKPATDDLAIIATCKKAMFARKDEIVGPYKARLDAMNQAFADLMFPVLEADRLTRGQVNDFGNEQRRKAAEAQRIEDEKLRLAREEEKLTGEHTVELGTAPSPPPVPEHTRTGMGTLGGRTNWKARVVDFALLPDEYKLPNEQKLNAHARSTKGERPIPGVEFYDDRVVTMRTKS